MTGETDGQREIYCTYTLKRFFFGKKKKPIWKITVQEKFPGDRPGRRPN